MVAEPVEQAEELATDAQAPEVSNPDAEPVEELDEGTLESFLADQDLLPATAEGEATEEPAKANEPSLEGLTPQQIRDLGRQEGKSEALNETQARTAAASSAAERQGLVNVVSSARDAMIQAATEAGLDAPTVMRMARFVDQVNGAWNSLYQTDIGGANTSANAAFRLGMMDAAEAALGSKGFAAKHKDTTSSEAFFKDLIEEAVKTRGLLTPSEAQKQSRAAVVAAFKKLPKEARDAIGFNQASVSTAQNASGVSTRITNATQNDRAFNEGRISREQYAANEARFRGKAN